MMRRDSLAIALLIAAPLLWACPGDTGSDPVDDPMTWAVDEPGPYKVGIRMWEVSYDPPAGEPTRTIPLTVWYPTNARQGPAGSYLFGTIDDPDTILEAPLAPSPYADGNYPVHLHTHGSRGYAGTTAYLMRYYASHGWVVIAPDHIDNTLGDNVDPRPTAHYFERPMDLTRALDALEELPEDDPLAGKADTSRVVVSGHSFGTYSSWAIMGSTYDETTVREACANELAEGCTEDQIAVFPAGFGDDRVVAAFPMAGTVRRAWLGAEGHRTVNGPILSMTGTSDPVGQQDQWDEMDAIDFTWIDIEGGCHQLFALGGCFDISNEVGFPIVQTWGPAFGRAYVLEDDSATTTGILDGSVSMSDLVSFQRMMP